MNTLVTGAAGFIGGRMAKRLTNNRGRVYGLIHDNYLPVPQWHPIRGDITDYPRLLEIITNCEIDRVFHFAARSIVRNCRVDPLGCFQVNVMGTANILEAIRQSERSIEVMCMESDKSYGDGPTPYEEHQALQPSGIYEASKACVSHLVRSYHINYGVKAFTVRSANVYGPGDPNMSRLVPNTITRLLRKEKPQITNGADSFLREFIYVEDFLDLAISLVGKIPWGTAINVGTGDTHTVGDVIRLICELMNESFSTENWDRPKTLTEIPEQFLSLTQLKKTLSTLPAPTPIKIGLEHCIQWYRKQR